VFATFSKKITLKWQQLSGLWEITVIPENTTALAFWRKSVSDFTNGQYSM